jgi:RNA polymerase sigma-70 factor (ECF subfamily)
MAASATSGEISLMHYREYLLLVARVNFDARLQGELDPSDIVQEALLKAQRALHQFRGHSEQQLAAWLRTILSHTLQNAVRTYGRQQGGTRQSLDRALDESSVRLQTALASGQLSPDQVASRNEELLRLAEALQQLPQDQRIVLELKHLHGYTVAEICERTNRTKPSVVGLLHRGMKGLRVLLKNPESGADTVTAGSCP